MAVETKRAATRLVRALLVCAIGTGGCAMPAGPMNGMGMPGREASAVFEKLQAQRAARNAATSEQTAATHAPNVSELLHQGDRARDDGDLAAALFSYLRAHRASDGADWDAAARIGYLHLREEPMRAEAMFERLVARYPDVSQLHTGLALARLAQNRARDARAPLERAVALDAEAATPRNVIAVLLDRLGDHAAAQAQYRAARALRPSDPAILNNLGVSLLLSGQAPEAAQVLRQALNYAPGDHATRNNLGVALALDDQIAEAYTLFADAGGDARAHNNLGYVLHLRGEHARALAHFEQALGVSGKELPIVLANLERARHALETGAGSFWRPATPIAATPEPAAVAIAEEIVPAEPTVAITEEIVPVEPVVAIAEESVPSEPLVAVAEEIVPAEPVVAIAAEIVPAEPTVAITEEIVPVEPVVAVADAIVPAEPGVEETAEIEPVEVVEEIVADEPVTQVVEAIEPLVPAVPVREVEVTLVSAQAVPSLMLSRPPVRRTELSLEVPEAEIIEAPAAAGFGSRSFAEIVEALLGPAGPQLPHAQIESFEDPSDTPAAALDPTAG